MAYRGPDEKPESVTAIESLSGSSVNITASNTSNTASSAARFTAVVAGASAADAYYVATVTGAASWSWGLDNSDSDSFVIGNAATLGGANILKLTSAGAAVTGTLEVSSDVTTSGSYKVNASSNIGTISWTPSTTRTVTIPDATTTVVGTDVAQTLTNKTLTAPVIATIVNSGTLTLPTSTDTLVGRATTDTLTNKTLTAPVIATIVNSGTLTLPTSTDTLVGRATTDTLTNKTLTSPVINTSVSGTAILDEDNMASNSDTKLATQQSIKAYVDSNSSSNNLIMNGNFDFWNRGNGVTYSGGTTRVFGPDRWGTTAEGTITGTFTFAQDTSVPTVAESGFRSRYAMHIDVTGTETPAAADYLGVAQSIEGPVFNAVSIGQNVVMSFWVKSTKTGVSCVSFRNATLARSYVAEYTINSSDTWEYKTITLTTDTSGTWQSDVANAGVVVGFTLCAGSNLQTTAGAWQAGDFTSTSNQVNHMDSTSNNFRIAQVKFAKGNTATAFTRHGGTYASDQQACERYYQIVYTSLNIGNSSGGQTFNVPITFRTEMNQVPTMTYITSSASGNLTSRSTNNVTVYGASYEANASGSNVFDLSARYSANAEI